MCGHTWLTSNASRDAAPRSSTHNITLPIEIDYTYGCCTAMICDPTDLAASISKNDFTLQLQNYGITEEEFNVNIVQKFNNRVRDALQVDNCDISPRYQICWAFILFCCPLTLGMSCLFGPSFQRYKIALLIERIFDIARTSVLEWNSAYKHLNMRFKFIEQGEQGIVTKAWFEIELGYPKQ